MQLTNLVTALAIAATTATALPAAEGRSAAGLDLLAPRTGGGHDGSLCNNNQQPVCCNGLLGILGCAVGILGNNCEGASYCCETNAAPVGFFSSFFFLGDYVS